MEVSGDDSISGEKDPGIEWRIGLGNTRGECGVEAGLEGECSKLESRSVDPLGVGSGSRIEVSRWEGVRLDVVFLIKRPAASLGGCFGMRQVTQGDRKVESFEGRG